MLTFCSLARADLLHRYSFNDGTANDSVGAANGSLLGGAIVSGGAVQFNGTSAYVDLPGPALAVNTYSSLTLELWLTVNSSSNGGYTMAAAFGRTGSDYLGHQYLALITPLFGGGSRAAISPDFWNRESTVLASQFDYGREHYVAITVDALSLTYYLDGSFVGSCALNGVTLSDLSNDLAYLGRSLYFYDAYETGFIDECRIWNNALSAGQVAANAAAGPNVVPEPGVLALFGMAFGALLLFRRQP